MEYFYLLAVRFGIVLFLNHFKSINFKENTEDKDSAKNNPFSKREKVFSYIKDISIVAISAQIMIFPMIAYIYSTVSFSFIITNILTSYLIGIIIIVGFILILISFPFLEFAKFLGKGYKLLIDLLLFITEKTAKIPFSKIYVKTPFLFEIVFYYSLIFSFTYLYKKFRTRRDEKSFKKYSKYSKNKI